MASSMRNFDGVPTNWRVHDRVLFKTNPDQIGWAQEVQLANPEVVETDTGVVEMRRAGRNEGGPVGSVLAKLRAEARAEAEAKVDAAFVAQDSASEHGQNTDLDTCVDERALKAASTAIKRWHRSRKRSEDNLGTAASAPADVSTGCNEGGEQTTSQVSSSEPDVAHQPFRRHQLKNPNSDSGFGINPNVLQKEFVDNARCPPPQPCFSVATSGKQVGGAGGGTVASSTMFGGVAVGGSSASSGRVGVCGGTNISGSRPLRTETSALGRAARVFALEDQTVHAVKARDADLALRLLRQATRLLQCPPPPGCPRPPPDSDEGMNAASQERLRRVILRLFEVPDFDDEVTWNLASMTCAELLSLLRSISAKVDLEDLNDGDSWVQLEATLEVVVCRSNGGRYLDEDSDDVCEIVERPDVPSRFRRHAPRRTTMVVNARKAIRSRRDDGGSQAQAQHVKSRTVRKRVRKNRSRANKDVVLPTLAEDLAKGDEEVLARRAELPLAEYRRLSAMGGTLLHHRGINIQQPWASLIVRGVKTVEARRYALKGYQHEMLWVIETPGKTALAHCSESTLASMLDGDKASAAAVAEELAFAANVAKRRRLFQRSHSGVSEKARIVGAVRFRGDVCYSTYDEWRADAKRHRVPANTPFDWRPEEGPMYGWEVDFTQALAVPQPEPAMKGMIGSCAITRLAVFD
eukprot:TRINITY_DN42735_c0_g1_i1.p1 TRINITY_DN42735_c0_g1~~TRINITY_DN42735_c0_g1_i1.p1  ORF type:complete len:756 (-),score=129.10 TRINITY_DN42735_c0_g1_i1:123-2198(-)